MTTPDITLEAALRRTYEDRWSRCRDGGKCLMAQAEQAVGTLIMLRREVAPDHPDLLTVGEAKRHVRAATAVWYRMGLSPATITKRLNCLGALGVDLGDVKRPKPDKKLKWWLRPEEERRVHAYLEDHKPFPGWMTLSHFIGWTTKTGLRIEESLRLGAGDFSADYTEVLVPGTKTASSQATLALCNDAQELAESRMVDHGGQHYGMWEGLTYRDLAAMWDHLRTAMGWPDGATLKALRRTAARYLHVDCGMPLDMVRQYLRHADIETTMGYLRLTGGYSLAEQRRYLK